MTTLTMNCTPARVLPSRQLGSVSSGWTLDLVNPPPCSMQKSQCTERIRPHFTTAAVSPWRSHVAAIMKGEPRIPFAVWRQKRRELAG